MLKWMGVGGLDLTGLLILGQLPVDVTNTAMLIAKGGMIFTLALCLVVVTAALVLTASKLVSQLQIQIKDLKKDAVERETAAIKQTELLTKALVENTQALHNLQQHCLERGLGLAVHRNGGGGHPA